MERVDFDKGSAHRVACPHLGGATDRYALSGGPSESHRCFAYGQIELISLHHQEQCCLRVHWTCCYKLQAGYQPVSTYEPAHGALQPGPAVPPDEAGDDFQTARLSLATQRLLSRSAERPPSPQTEQAEAPARDASPASAPVSGARAETRRDPSGTEWQIPLLWLSITVPVLLLLATVGLIGVVALDSTRAVAQTEWPVVVEETQPEEMEPLPAIEISMVTPTPVATFAPVREDPATPYMAPAIPSPPPVNMDGLAEIAPWPETLADGPPEAIAAPQVGVNTSILPVGSYIKEVDGQPIRFYQVAEYAAGWHENSALPGARGNVVVAGHNTVAGGVFRHVGDLEPGQVIFLKVEGRSYPYVVAKKEIVAEANVSDEKRAENGRWIAQSEDERLTLVTCWPPGDNTHRAIVVGVPLR